MLRRLAKAVVVRLADVAAAEALSGQERIEPQRHRVAVGGCRSGFPVPTDFTLLFAAVWLAH